MPREAWRKQEGRENTGLVVDGSSLGSLLGECSVICLCLRIDGGVEGEGKRERERQALLGDETGRGRREGGGR